MAFDHQYPYTDFHELNLDWILDKIAGLDNRLNEIEHNIELLQEDCQNLHEICDNLNGFINDLLDADQKILKMIALEYDEVTQYDPDFLVRYEGKIYKCKPGQTPGPFDSDYWEETDLGTELGNLLYNYYTSLLPHISDIDDNITELYTLFDIIGKEYDPNNTYYSGQTCHYEGKEYICNTDNTTGAWDPSKWTETSVNALLDNIAVLGESISDIRNMIAADYDSSLTYQSRDYCIFNDKLYRNTGGSTTGTFDQSKWTEVNVTDEIDDNKTYMVAHGFAHYDEVLMAGNTSVIFAQTSTYDDTILVFTDQFGLAPTAMSQDPLSGFWTITFPAQAVDVNVRILVYGTYEH